jgi:hypothetical protein
MYTQSHVSGITFIMYPHNEKIGKPIWIAINSDDLSNVPLLRLTLLLHYILLSLGRSLQVDY